MTMVYGAGYTTVHPNATSPTVIQPSPTEPIVVPIHGGKRGYVVVPPIGMNLQVYVSYDCDMCSRSAYDIELICRTRGI